MNGSKNKPFITVIVPSYNMAHFLPQCLASIRHQGRDDLEVIVVDDGSTDNTADVVAGFPEVRRVRQENKGLAGARNTGIGNAGGEYLLFLDADDLLRPDAVRLLLERMMAFPSADVVYGRGCYFRVVNGRKKELSGRCSRVMNEDDLFKHLLIKGNHILIGSLLVRCALFADVRFDEQLRVLEDRDLWLELARKGCRFAAIDRKIVDIRLHGASLSVDRQLIYSVKDKILAQYEEEFRRKNDDARLAWVILAQAANLINQSALGQAREKLFLACRLDRGLILPALKQLLKLLLVRIKPFRWLIKKLELHG